MRQYPFKNVHDVQVLARKAFNEITPDFVRNTYAHVKEQEDYYRRLDGIELQVSEFSTVVEEIQADSVDDIANSEQNLLAFNEQEQTLVPVPLEADIEVIVDVPELDQPFFCSMCDFKTSASTLIDRHFRSHYNCNLCQKPFHGLTASRDYKRHLNTHQPKKSSDTKCSYCEKTFRNQWFLNRHTKQHKTTHQPKKSSEPKCSYCEKTFRNHWFLNRHMKRHKTRTTNDNNVTSESPLPAFQLPLVTKISTSSDQPNKSKRKQKLEDRPLF